MTPVNIERVKTFKGIIIGYIETDAQGNKRAKTFSGRIISEYNKLLDTTKTFSGRIIGRGDLTNASLYNPEWNPEYNPNVF